MEAKAFPAGMKELTCDEIAGVFEEQFSQSHSIRLIGGAEEPIYIPAGAGPVSGFAVEPINRLVFTRDYAASALHEISHWCIASNERLEKMDWGYWYIPDGRNLKQQQAFEKVEANNQALEWILNKAAGRRFRISVDNLNGEQCSSETFKDEVYRNAQSFCQNGLPERAMQFFLALQHASEHCFVLDCRLFSRSDLD